MRFTAKLKRAALYATAAWLVVAGALGGHVEAIGPPAPPPGPQETEGQVRTRLGAASPGAAINPGAGVTPGANPGAGADANLESLWTALADANAATALDAVTALTGQGSRAIAFLRIKQPPISSLDAAAVPRLIDQLDAPEYAVRQQATDQLSLRGTALAKALADAQKTSTSPETRDRLETLINNASSPAPTIPAACRWLRAVRALERIGTPEARDLLGQWASGAPDARATQQAQEALVRLGRTAKTDSPTWWLARAEEEAETLAPIAERAARFGDLSCMLSDAGLLQPAAALARRAEPEEGARLEPRYHLAAAYARAGRRQEALEVAALIHEPDGRTEINCRIGIALASAGSVEPAVPPPASADWMAATIAQPPATAAAATWKVSESQVRAAQARIHAAIARAHAAAGRKDLYRQHIALAQELIDKIKVDIDAAWGAAFSSAAPLSNAEANDAMAALYKTKAIEAVTLARAQAGDYDGARAALGPIPKGGIPHAQSRILAEDLADRGLLQEALATAEGIENKTHRDLALLSVLGGYLRTGDRAGAQAALNKMSTAVPPATQPAPNNPPAGVLAGARAAQESLNAAAYNAVAHLALQNEPGADWEYQAAARYQVTIRRLARIQVQTPGRDRQAIFKWVEALPQTDSRYQALLGAAEGILALQTSPQPAPATTPAAPLASPGSNPLTTAPAAH